MANNNQVQSLPVFYYKLPNYNLEFWKICENIFKRNILNIKDLEVCCNFLILPKIKN